MGLAAGPNGRLHVLDQCLAPVWSGARVALFRRDGSYERTIMPFPAGTPVEKASAAGAFINSSGALNPLKHRYTDDIYHQPAILPDGRLMLAVGRVKLSYVTEEICAIR